MQRTDLTHYLETLEFGLVHIPNSSKAPKGNGWQLSPVTTTERATQVWANGGNVGLHHASSRTAVLDIDHPEWAALALAAVDIDLETLLNAPGPKIKGAKGLKPLYRLPNGLELKRHALAWKEPETDKALTVLELRAGLVQDVLPPSIHPDTKKPYTWHPESPQSREDIPELPSNLRSLWENWGVLRPILDKAQPWAAPPPPRIFKDAGGGVIGAYNDRYDVREILECYGYPAKGADRYLSPHSSTGTPGIVVLEGDDGLERVYCHHASDPLYSEAHSHDAFSVFATLEHDGDVKAAVRAAAMDLGMSYKRTPRTSQDTKVAQTERRSATKPRPMLTRLADVVPQDVAWLWHPYIPLGKLTLLEGDPGLGKTFLALTLAAIITRGYPFPGQDGGMSGAREPENVLYMSAEDGLADTLRPRLDAAGADVSRVHALTGWQAEDAEGETIEGAVSLAHIAVLEQTMQEINPRLVIVDPLQAYLGAGVDMHRANEVRPVLSALSSLAEKYNFAAVCIRHLGKAAKGRAVYAGLGSIDFAAAARSMLLVAEHPEAPHMRVMAHVKSSLALAGKSISYEIKDGAILWAGPTEHTAEDLLATKGFDNERGSSDEASEFLKDFLAEGAQPAQDVLKASREIGIAKRTLERAKKDLEVTSHRASAGNEGAGKWLWSLPSKHAGGLATLQKNYDGDATLATPPTYTAEPLATLHNVREEPEKSQDRKVAKELSLEDDFTHLVGSMEGVL